MSQIDKRGENSVEIDFGGSIDVWKEEENITKSLEIFSADKNHAIDYSSLLSIPMLSWRSEPDADAAVKEADEMSNDRENACAEKMPKDISEIDDIEMEVLADNQDEETSPVATEAATANSLEMNEEFESAIDELLDDVTKDNQDGNPLTIETIVERVTEEDLQIIDPEAVKRNEGELFFSLRHQALLFNFLSHFS